MTCTVNLLGMDAGVTGRCLTRHCIGSESRTESCRTRSLRSAVL